jgi:hypothetical protein
MLDLLLDQRFTVLLTSSLPASLPLGVVTALDSSFCYAVDTSCVINDQSHLRRSHAAAVLDVLGHCCSETGS